MATSPDTKLIEDITNWTFPGLSLYYRDTTLTPQQVGLYQPGALLRSSIFLDVSSLADGIAGNTRYLIASAHALSMAELNPDRPELATWHAYVINANSYFKVLHVQTDNATSQITLLHVPARWVTLQAEQPFSLQLEQTITTTAAQRFAQAVSLPPAPALQSAEWQDRTKLPVGLDDHNHFFALERDQAVTAVPLYRALQKVLADTTGLD